LSKKTRKKILFTKLHKKRIENKVKAKIIFTEDSKGKFPEQEKSKLVETKYLLNLTPAAINIYGNITIIALLTNQPITFLIRSNEVAESFKQYFNELWKSAR
jgi:hypothetical protein